MFTRDDTLRNNQVKIREFIAIHAGDQDHSYGEFTGITFNSDEDKQRAAQESGESLIQRMMAHIKEIASEVIQVHINENFSLSNNLSGDSKPTLIEENANCITRLSFQEFHFYPYEKRGPLSMDELSIFLEKFEDYVATLPPNLHMLIATLPVIDQHQRVYNMCIYVESGKSPKMHVFAKNMPSNTDLEYANTITPFLTGGSQVINLVQRIKELTNSINDQLKTTHSPDVKSVDDLIKLCSMNREFTHDDETQTPTDTFLDIMSNCQSLKDIAIHHQQLTSADVFDQLSRLNHSIKCFTKHIKESTYNSALDNSKKFQQHEIPNIVLTDKLHKDIAINFDGTIHCSTSGGEQFTTIVDICIDHAYGVGHSRFNANLSRLSKDKSLPVSRLMSQIITSNTIDLHRSNILSHVTVHADSQTPSVNRSHRFVDEKPEITTINQTTFGGVVNLCKFSSHPVASLRGHHLIKVDLHNLRVELDKLESAKSRYKSFNASVEKRIAILREKIAPLLQADSDLSRLNSIARILCDYDQENVSDRTWISHYVNFLSKTLTQIVNESYSTEIKNNIAGYIHMINSERAHDACSKLNELATILDEITSIMGRLEERFKSSLSAQHPSR